MKIGIPTEVKAQEYRVALTPSAVADLQNAGHQVVIQSGAGDAAGFCDRSYTKVGAYLADDAKQLYADTDMIVKVKEPQESEYDLLRPGQILFTYLHLAASRPLTQALVKSRSIAFAYETVTNASRRFPLLTPMSEIAGRVAMQAGIWFLQSNNGGSGVLLPGVTGVERGRVVIIGGGVVGENAAIQAMGLGADVWIFDASIDRLRELSLRYGPRLHTNLMSHQAVVEMLSDTDLLIGSVLAPGDKAPHVLSREDIAQMKDGSVLVDVAIDQGGCFETSKMTTHQDPIYVVDGVLHYCVANMPSVCARTASQALANATLPYVRELADKGWREAMVANPHLANGLNVCDGRVTLETVSNLFDLDFYHWEALAK